jgi:hypothetical protein
MNPAKLGTIGVLAVLLVAGLGCSEGGFGDTSGDAGVEDTQRGTGDTDDDQDTETDDPDSGDETSDGDSEPDGGEPTRPAQESFSSCSAGGISSGNGVKAVQCYGPVETSGREASGGGVKWQSGAFRVISEGTP